MYWLNRHIDLTETKYEVFVVDKSNKYIDFFKSYAVAIEAKEIIPCWSLAALLDVLPFPDLFYNDGWNLYVTINDKIININYIDNPIDACVEMIMKLKEKNLL